MANLKIPSHVPTCPNHGAPLEGIPFPMQPKGTGMCPVSGCPFDYEVDLGTEANQQVQDKFGNMTTVPKWKLTGDDK